MILRFIIEGLWLYKPTKKLEVAFGGIANFTSAKSYSNIFASEPVRCFLFHTFFGFSSETVPIVHLHKSDII